MKKKKIVIGAICAVLLICAAAFFTAHQNSVVYGLSEGTYSSQTDSSQITFDIKDDGSISYVYKIHEEVKMQGGASFKLGKLVLKSDNAEDIYKFKITDNDYIEFISSKSSDLYMDDGITLFENGAAFKFSDEG